MVVSEFWDPETGGQTAGRSRNMSEGVEVNVRLPEGGSVFVVFPKVP